ncbi:MAG: multicopper oxidase domain-containing protein [Rhizobiales bacterium]|nr:multicopper oxidase domain-containing protein [Hyphomicrobiales bacterium]
MFIQPIDYALAVWFVLAAASTAYVAYDQFRNNPEPKVMKWGFVLITLYMGVFGLLLYVLADKEPRPRTHEEFISPLWKQAVGSTIHYLAGDATGIIRAAAFTALLGWPMAVDLVIEYVAGFAFGLFIFQSLFMMRMMGGSYWENVRRTFVPELISMNAMMAGMAPTMSLLMMGRDMRAMDPAELVFWGAMSVGVIIGFAMAYAFNVWMVSVKLKHGLMTMREGRSGAHAAQKHAPPSTMPRKHKHRDQHGQMGLPPAWAPTGPQQAAMAGVTGVFLLAGMIVPGFYVNLTLGARDVGGIIMPKGMIMDFNTPAESMRDMAAIQPRHVAFVAPVEARGDQPLEPRIENGVKVFDLEASVIRWNILPHETVEAYAYNRQVPGPRIRVTQGDRIRINFKNQLPEKTTIHWHGMILPNVMDGPSGITQDPVPPGGTYVYEFDVGQSGTYFYHTHADSDRQQAFGLYGALIIDPRDPDSAPRADLEYTILLQEWLKREWLTYPAMIMEGGLPNFFTINGKAYPATDTIHMKVGQTIKLRFIGSHNNFIHPMHVHGGPFEVVAVDGETLAPTARYLADTVNVGPGQRYDVIWTARRPGKWLVHCHIPHHTKNNNTESHGGGGLVMILNVEG